MSIRNFFGAAWIYNILFKRNSPRNHSRAIEHFAEFNALEDDLDDLCYINDDDILEDDDDILDDDEYDLISDDFDDY